MIIILLSLNIILFVIDLIREIREANRNCEENLITRVKSMLEERCNQQAKGMDELKVCI